MIKLILLFVGDNFTALTRRLKNLNTKIGTINLYNNFVYLGIRFDKKLSFMNHINEKIQKGELLLILF